MEVNIGFPAFTGRGIGNFPVETKKINAVRAEKKAAEDKPRIRKTYGKTRLFAWKERD